MKFIAWTVLCFIAATDMAGRFCHNRLNEILVLLQLNFHTTTSLESTTFLAQKGLHVLLYALLGFFAASERDSKRRMIANAAGASISILTEVFQYFTETRHMSAFDMALNLTAFTIVAAWCMWSQRLREAPLSDSPSVKHDGPKAMPFVSRLRSEEIGD